MLRLRIEHDLQHDVACLQCRHHVSQSELNLLAVGMELLLVGSPIPDLW
jgi:hypothetical protein